MARRDGKFYLSDDELEALKGVMALKHEGFELIILSEGVEGQAHLYVQDSVEYPLPVSIPRKWQYLNSTVSFHDASE